MSQLFLFCSEEDLVSIADSTVVEDTIRFGKLDVDIENINSSNCEYWKNFVI